MGEPTDERFSLVIGGPFYRLQQRLGLLGPDLLPTARTAALLALIAWLPPAILSVFEGNDWAGTLAAGSYFLDFSAYARFLPAVLMFTLMEPIAELRLGAMVHQFQQSRLVRDNEQSLFAAALGRADRRSGSTWAELVILGVAFAVSAAAIHTNLEVLRTSWLGAGPADSSAALSPAGWWAMLVSYPLFWFLLLRWIWRFIVWAILLRDIARLDLRLVATHPDRGGGIGFLGLYPPTFAPLVFALSCVTAAVTLQSILFAGMALKSTGMIFLVWLIVVVLIFVGPLFVFCLPLVRLKKRALLEYGNLATGHNRAFEERWLRPTQMPEDMLGAPEVSSLADLGTGFAAVEAMRPIPAGQETVLPLFIAAALPWLAVLATQMPLVQILAMLAKAFL
jgi:hypothetical protein